MIEVDLRTLAIFLKDYNYARSRDSKVLALSHFLMEIKN